MFKKFILAGCIAFFLGIQFTEARVGSGRSFGNRGSRGFSAPTWKTSPQRNYGTSPYSNPYRQQPQQQPYSAPSTSSFGRPSLLKTFGAGLAGGVLGGLISRSIGHAYPGLGMGGVGGVGGGGIGLLEIILLGGLIYFIFRWVSHRRQKNFASIPLQGEPQNGGAESLMQKARYEESWSQPSGNESYHQTSHSFSSNPISTSNSISTDLAMDLFFQVQGAWKTRDLSTISSLLDSDAREFLEREITQLRTNSQINCLENIAVRRTEVVEAWEEDGRTYSTVHFSANLLDYTIDERTQQVVAGSKVSPVKFEEYWTFSKDRSLPHWKLSAIQQI